MNRVLAALVLTVAASARVVEAADAAVEASGETTIDDGACQPTHFLGGKLSSCDTFHIATLNASPRRCLHIEAPPPSSDDGPVVCTDYPNWFDGTNGCKAYGMHTQWCEEFKDANYGPYTPHTANQACCACGGGKKRRPRLQVGEYVKVTGVRTFDQCESLKIVEIGDKPKFHYVLEATKDCGPKTIIRDGRGGATVRHSVEAGTKVTIASDEESVISRNTRVELKRCKNGRAEQEFELIPIVIDDDSSGSDMIDIRHKHTGFDLASVFQARRPFFNISQAFEDGLFDESGDFYLLKVVSNLNEGRVYADGLPYRPTMSYLASGFFGETEYSLAQIKSENAHRGFKEQEFSMWRFLPFQKDESGGDESGSASVDEHAEWLVRMTHMIGIDYLTQLPPWHLLDVERDASKGDVKSRFRELSRYFHPDKVNQSEKKELFERIFVVLQNAYSGLKGANEKEKEDFRVAADASSQLFVHSQYVIELLPFHWTALDNTTESENSTGKSGGRYILNAASHLEEEIEPSVQMWVTFMYNARCGMSRTVTGMVDLAARHLEEYEGIKVGAYGCGLYSDVKGNDQLGVTTDPICAQFKRRETPNVHLIVETVPGRRKDDNGVWVEVQADPDLIRENAQFKHFYAAVPNGNTTQFFPHNFIEFARAGKRVWQNNHLIHRMKSEDFSDPHFIGNVSIVAYLDGTGNGDTNSEVVDAITASLPGVAKRFVKEDVYVGMAQCGYGDDDDFDENGTESQRQVDCSKLGVAWLPDIKVYSVNDTIGTSLLRGHFSDMRDVQIALESMGNVLRMMLGGEDEDDDDDLEELEEEDTDAGGGNCQQQPPPPPDNDLDLDEIEGRMEDTPLLEEASETKPALEKESKSALDKEARKPKLASGDDKPKLAGGREGRGTDRISGFHKRESRRVGGGGQMLGGGSGGSAGFIA